MKLIELRVSEFCSFWEHHWENISDLEAFTLLDLMLLDANGNHDALEIAELVAGHGVRSGHRCFVAVVLRWLLIHSQELASRREPSNGRN